MPSHEPTAASTAAQHFQTTSTLDEPGPGLLVQISIDGDHYQWLLSEPREKLGPPLLDEADRYRKALPNG